MNPRRSVVFLALSLATGIGVCAAPDDGAGAVEKERNAWPFLVRQTAPAGEITAWNGAGPFLFKKTDADGGKVAGFRPFWVESHDAGGDFRSATFLYPIFSYRVEENMYNWSVLELIRRSGNRADAAPPKSTFEQRRDFEVWPFWFSREAGDPELNYRGLFPIAGTLKNKFGMQRISWVLFPFFIQTEEHDAVTTHSPWPILRVTRGAAHGGGIWPLFTFVERPGVSREAYYLWPLGFNVTQQPSADDPAGTAPKHDAGFLPLFTRSTGPGSVSESYAWPFFGFTDRTIPTRYHETRYFWPLLVQGRGDDRFVNRWGPFYTHSVIKGYDKTWYAWPLVRRAEWLDEGIVRNSTQVFFFLYWTQRQRLASRPEQPAASLTHVWPLLSAWDNGAGRRQWQVFSPLDVFFPNNEKVHNAWSPFFALLRHDQRAPGETRTSLLWDAITWTHSELDDYREFHVGPLLGVRERGGEKRVTFGLGLFGFERSTTDHGWKMFWLDFRGKPVTDSLAQR